MNYKMRVKLKSKITKVAINREIELREDLCK
jgi:hypothetical protein